MGTLDRGVIRRLFNALGTRERAEFCSAIWVGYADIRPRRGRRIILPPDREMTYSTTTLADLMASTERVPLHLWATDLRWAIGNDIYARSVFVGCDTAAAKTLLEDDELEAFLVTCGDAVSAEDL